MPYKFGDVLLVRFPFTSQTAFKQRPAVVVSSHAYNASRPDVVLMAITSRVPLSLGLGEMTIADWQASGLLKASAIKPVIATLEQALVLRPLGTLQPPDVARLRDVLASLLQ